MTTKYIAWFAAKIGAIVLATALILPAKRPANSLARSPSPAVGITDSPTTTPDQPSIATALEAAGKADESPAESEQPIPATTTVGTAASIEARSTPAVLSLTEQMLAENNRIRSNYGRLPIILDSRLTSAAQNHADYLAWTGKLEHSGDNGNPISRAAAQGFAGMVSENAAGNFSSIPNVFNGWLSSSVGHSDTLLSTEYDCCGFGYAVGQSGGRWVALYGQSTPYATPAARQVAPSGPSALVPQGSCAGGFCSPAQYVPQRRGPVRFFRRR